MIKPLLPEGHELLEQETIPFSFWSPPINPIEFRDELIENMKYYDGVGLSANQLGYRYSVFAMNHEGNSMAVYNPQIIEESEENVWETEGCLTYPGLYIKISRPKSLSASWEDAENNPLNGYFSDLSARIFLHEMDHIKGKIFYESASQIHIQNARRKRRTFLKKIKTSSPTLWQSHLNNKKQERVLVKTF